MGGMERDLEQAVAMAEEQGEGLFCRTKMFRCCQGSTVEQPDRLAEVEVEELDHGLPEARQRQFRSPFLLPAFSQYNP